MSDDKPLDDRISPDELREIFGETLPIEAMGAIVSWGGTANGLRRELRAIATERGATAAAQPAVRERVAKEQEEEIARLREALEEIARQKFTGEMDHDERRWADYQGGYNVQVKIARAALAQEG